MPGAIAGDSNGAARFNGTSSFASAPVNLSTLRTITVEFWLRWNAFDTSDDLAMELTPNSGTNAGGFLVDPDESASGLGKFGLSMRQGPDWTGYNNAFFDRPAAGFWHHYAIVLDRSAAAAGEISVYVDGVLQTTFKTSSVDTTDGVRELHPVLHEPRGERALRGGRPRRGRAVRPGPERGDGPGALRARHRHRVDPLASAGFPAGLPNS